MNIKNQVQKWVFATSSFFQWVGVLASYVWHIYLPDAFAKATSKPMKTGNGRPSGKMYN